MNFKPHFLLFIALISVSAFSQKKVYYYDEIQTRNNLREWSCSKKSEAQAVSFSSNQIHVNIDKAYHLNIISRTFLPENGTIFLCKDDQNNSITVTLLNDDKMYLYNQGNRFLINFTGCSEEIVSTQDSYADAR